MSDALFYRIATSQAGLETGANFFIRGIPWPDLCTFTDHAQRVPQSQGGEARQGYASVSLLWLQLIGEAAAVLRGLIETAEVTGGQGNGTLYLTVPRTDAKYVGASWIDVSGIAIMPAFNPVHRAPGLYENVEFRLANVTVLATPSTVMS